MSIVLVTVLAVLARAAPAEACDAEKAIQVAKREAGRRMALPKALVAHSVLGPISWHQVVAAFPEYRELDQPREEVGLRLVFVVGVTPRKETPAGRRQASAPAIVVGGGFEVWIDAETCKKIAILEGA